MHTYKLAVRAVCVLALSTQLLLGCKANTESNVLASPDSSGVQRQTLALFDSSRQRAVPVILYERAPNASFDEKTRQQKIAVISHGYGGKNTGYSFIANALVKEGYVVASILHEQPGDAPLARKGDIYRLRMPNWERGVQNIVFVLQHLRQTRPALDYNNLLLIGHSNGGDMSILFAQRYPRRVAKVISLDSRRMPFPRASHPKVLSLRSSDAVADEGVLPTPEECARFGIRIVQLPHTVHNAMWDGATAEQEQEMLTHILAFVDR